MYVLGANYLQPRSYRYSIFARKLDVKCCDKSVGFIQTYNSSLLLVPRVPPVYVCNVT